MPSLMQWVGQFAHTPPLRVWGAKVEGIVEGNVQNLGWSETIKQAATICDLTAFVTMGVALGVTQLRRMEESRGNSVDLNGAGDCKVRRFSDAQAFMTFMDAWVAENTNGVVQFKFAANGSVHTFAVERYYPVQNAPALFQVYQSYEGTYRFSDFLGITNVRDTMLPRIINRNLHRYNNHPAKTAQDPAFDYDLAQPPANLNQRMVTAWNNTKAAITRELNRDVGAATAASNLLRRPLNENDFRVNVLSTLRDMFAGTQNYQQLSGHISIEGTTQTDTILVMSGVYDVNNLERNMRDVRSGLSIGRGFVPI